MGAATSIGVPCVQNVPTPAGTVPTPSVNLVSTATIVPNVANIFYGALPIVNQLTENPVSTGSIPNGGLITGGICEESQNIGCSLTLNLGGMMATTMADPTGHNSDFNSFGMYLTPSPPVSWMVLS